MRTTARSSATAVPTSCACSVLPLANTTSMLCSPLTTWLLVTISPFVSIITPEPICCPCAVVTLSSTTAGSIFAIAASCWVSIVVLPVEVADAVVTDCAVVAVLLLLLPVNSHPAKSPTPKMRASTSVRSSIAPARPGRLFGGVGKACGPGGYLGGWNAFCSLGICATGASSRTPTDADDEYGGRSEYGRETSCSSCSIFVVSCFFQTL